MKIPRLKLGTMETLPSATLLASKQSGSTSELQRGTHTCRIPVQSPSNKAPHVCECLQDLASIHIPDIQAWPHFDDLPGYPNNPQHNSLSSPEGIRATWILSQARMEKGL